MIPNNNFNGSYFLIKKIWGSFVAIEPSYLNLAVSLNSLNRFNSNIRFWSAMYLKKKLRNIHHHFGTHTCYTPTGRKEIFLSYNQISTKHKKHVARKTSVYQSHKVYSIYAPIPESHETPLGKGSILPIFYSHPFEFTLVTNANDRSWKNRKFNECLSKSIYYCIVVTL